MEKRYRALRIIGTLYKIIGAIVLVVTIVSAVGVCLAGVIGGTAFEGFTNDFDFNRRGLGLLGGAVGGVISALVILLSGGIGGVTVYATGEAIYLLIDIEENTRAARLYSTQDAPHPQANP